LEIPHIIKNVALKSPRRTEFIKISGKMQVPYLIDENNGVQMFESKDIIDYLLLKYLISAW